MLDKKRKKELEELLVGLNIPPISNLKIINYALTHPSFVFEGNERAGEHNQRLEFLGDAVIGLIIAQYLYQKYPHKTEGELTKMRASIVCEAALAEGARALKLGKYLLLGKGEEQMGGANRASNLADCFEAFIGALYLNLGMEKIAGLIVTVLQGRMKKAVQGYFDDYKTKLQEHIQRIPENRLAYRIIQEEGPDHDKKFLAAVYLNDFELARGVGRTKKEAEQHAAKAAMNQLEDN